MTLIGPDGTMRRRMADTAASGDTGPWEDLLARALASLRPYRAVPGEAVCHLRVDDQVALVAEHDLSGPLYNLVTAVLAIGETPHSSARTLLAGISRHGTTRIVVAARTAMRGREILAVVDMKHADRFVRRVPDTCPGVWPGAQAASTIAWG